MDDQRRITQGARFLMTAAAFVIVVAGMRAAGSIIVPFILSLFIAMLCSPLLSGLRKLKIPNALAVLIILALILTIGLVLVTIVGTSINGLTQSLPTYQERITAQTAFVITWLKGLGLDVSVDIINEYFNPGRALRMAATTFSRLSGMLTNSFMILLTVIFLLLEASGLPPKLHAALNDPEESLARFEKMSESVNRYIGIKTLTSMATGISIGLWLGIIGVDYPFLWALLAFLLNYVPNIGSIIAAIPAVLLALIQFGAGTALITALGFVVVNVVVGSLIEPKFMGRGLGLSTLVVFLSLVFWGWVLGPVGMLLSVPLTMILKIALESNDDTRWIAIILGAGPPRETASNK
jgi:predicted PurR-regulated permease PerM